MDKKGFRTFLEGKKLSESQIEGSFSIARKFERFLGNLEKPKTVEKAAPSDFRKFSARMIERKLNSEENYIALTRYAWFLRNKRLYATILPFIDGAEVMDMLYGKLGEEVGEGIRGRIFEGIDRRYGIPNRIKCRNMAEVLRRMRILMSPEACKRVLAKGLRILEDAWYESEKKMYGESATIDEFLQKRGEALIAELKEIKKKKGFFFNQEVTDELIAFVEAHPEIGRGVRKGSIVYEAKIPYQVKEYIREKYEAKKRYYYCHCPWVKESLRKGATDIPAVFCNCSAAYHRKPYEVIFDKPIKAEVIASVVQGALFCRFAIHLPPGFKK